METGKIHSNGNGKRCETPCAACKTLRRRCAEKCVLAPYFPPNDPHQFSVAHHVFGASNIIKMLKDLPTERRGDAVISMVYEANARLRDPVYGCVGIISQLQHQVLQLQSQLAAAEAELLDMRLHQSNLMYVVSELYPSRDQEAKPISPTDINPNNFSEMK